MRYKNFLIFLRILLIIFLGFLFFHIFKSAGRFFYIRDLKVNGVSEEIGIIDKGVLTKGGFESREEIKSTENGQIKLNIFKNDGDFVTCQTGISKNMFESIKVGDKIFITYLPKAPSSCRVTSTIELSYSLVILSLVIAISVAPVLLGILIWVIKLCEVPKKNGQDRLTTHIDLIGDSVKCPQCNMGMEEGFMPGTTALHWRKMDEPIGLTPMVAGLKGTTFLFRRPIMHAYHCHRCEIITFRYGKEKK